MSFRELHDLRRSSSHLRRNICRAAVLAVAVGLSGCSSDRLFGRTEPPASTGSTSSSPSFGDRVSNLFSSKPAAQPAAQTPGAAAITAADIDCPTVEIRPGASTFALSTPGAEPTALSMRYQASFGQTARECKLAGNVLTIKVGIEGRVVVGPAGGPGQFEVPIRYAVVQEGPEPKPITTKLHWQPVTVQPGETNVSFTQIEEDLTFPLPRGNALEAYVVYVGFDRAAVKKEPEKKRPAKKPAPVAKRAN